MNNTTKIKTKVSDMTLEEVDQMVNAKSEGTLKVALEAGFSENGEVIVFCSRSNRYYTIHPKDLKNINLFYCPYIAPKYKVCQYDLDGELIDIYDTIKEATVKLGLHRSGISRCLNGKVPCSSKFLWRKKYVTDPTLNDSAEMYGNVFHNTHFITAAKH